MIDPSIPLQVKPIQAPDRLNMMAQVLGMQQSQNQNALAQYSLTKAARQDDQTNALMRAIQSGEIDPTTAQGISRASAIAPESPVIANLLKARETQSTIGKNDAEAGKFSAETTAKVTSQYRDQLANVNTPEQGAAWLAAQYKDPVLGKVVGSVPFEQAVAAIPTDPAQFADWRTRNSLGMAEYIKQNKPTVHVQNLGGASNMVSTPGLGGAPTVLSSTPITQSADNKATNAPHIQAVNMEQGGANSRNAASIAAENMRSGNTIAAENLRAGVTPGGGLDENTERTAQAIASGQLPAPTGMALLNPKNQRILGRVMEINPQYDSTTVAAKKAAAVAFTSGPLGNALRSVSTANAHLDQLGELSDALQNGNTQVVNKVVNYFAQQTGNPAVTNFDAIKNIVGQEVVKAIVAGGGGVGEREEAAKIFSSANSPAQLKGAIQHYRMVMGAQANNLMEQRRAAGLPDSTLPNYSNTNPTAGAAAPGGWSVIGVQPAQGK